MSETDALLRRSRELLDSARLLLDHGDTASSISRSYYAMFLAAEAALLTKQVTPASHRGVIGAFGEHFVKTGLVDRADGRDLARAHEQRVAAEYDATLRVPPEDAEGLLVVASRFVERVSDLLAG